jgi:hypothetical protein
MVIWFKVGLFAGVIAGQEALGKGWASWEYSKAKCRFVTWW